MGLEKLVAVSDVKLEDVVRRLGDAMVVMIDGALVAPGRALPETWREARLRTPGGTVTVARRPGGVAVVVFGNADEALRAQQERVVAALQEK